MGNSSEESPFKQCKKAFEEHADNAQLAADEVRDEAETIEHLEEAVIDLVMAARKVLDKVKNACKKTDDDLEEEERELETKLEEFSWV